MAVPSDPTDPLRLTPDQRLDASHLDGIRFRNGVVRWSYLESLGLKGSP